LRFVARAYFIADQDQDSAAQDCDNDGVTDDADASPCWALYRQSYRLDTDDTDGDGDTDETPAIELIADGVEQMQILYGEDTSDDKVPDSFVDAAAVANWSNVVAVKVGILVRSPHEYGGNTDTNTYNLFTGEKGCVVGAAGCVGPMTAFRGPRRVYSAMVEIRNRTVTN
jgi:hypothetical protein